MIAEPIPNELKEKIKKMEALGGSQEAKVYRLESYLVIAPLPEEELADSAQRAYDPQQKVVWVESEGTRVLIRDPALPPSVPAAQAVRAHGGFRRAFPAAAARGWGLLRPGSSLRRTLGSELVETVWTGGHNATLLAWGPRGAGKTGHALGLLDHFLEEVYDRAAPGGAAAVGLSAWEVGPDNAHRDLLETGAMAARRREARARARARGGPPPPLDFVAVACGDLRAARAAVGRAQRAAASFTFPRDPEAAPAPRPGRAHLFVRVAVHRRDCGGTLATLHLVDLAGVGPSNEDTDIAEESRLQLQLSTVSKVISELGRAGRAGSESQGGAVAISARESALARALVPLLAGNSRPFLLACLRAGAGDFSSARAALRLVAAAGPIETACVRRRGVPLEDLDLVPLSRVLPHAGPPPPGDGAAAAAAADAAAAAGADAEAAPPPPPPLAPLLMPPAGPGAGPASPARALLRRVTGSMRELDQAAERAATREQQRRERSPSPPPTAPVGDGGAAAARGGDDTAWLRDYEESRPEVLAKVRAARQTTAAAVATPPPSRSIRGQDLASPRDGAPEGWAARSSSAPLPDGHGPGKNGDQVLSQASSLSALRSEINTICEQLLIQKESESKLVDGPLIVGVNEAKIGDQIHLPHDKKTYPLVQSIRMLRIADANSHGFRPVKPRKHDSPPSTPKEERDRMLSLASSNEEDAAHGMEHDGQGWLEKEEIDDDFPYPGNSPPQAGAQTNATEENAGLWKKDIQIVIPPEEQKIEEVLTPITNAIQGPLLRSREASAATGTSGDDDEEEEESVHTLVSRGAVARAQMEQQRRLRGGSGGGGGGNAAAAAAAAAAANGGEGGWRRRRPGPGGEGGQPRLLSAVQEEGTLTPDAPSTLENSPAGSPRGPGSPRAALAAPPWAAAAAAGGEGPAPNSPAALDQTYKDLLGLLEEERCLRGAAADRSREAEHGLLEAVTQYELQVDNLRLENHRLQARVRRLERKGGDGTADLFRQYEEDLQRLNKECEALRRQNAELGLQNEGRGRLNLTSSDDNSKLVLIQKQTKRIKQLQNENNKLRQELFTVRKRTREGLVSQRVADAATKRANELGRKIQAREDQLQTSLLSSAAAGSRLQKAESTARRAEAQAKRSREELERAMAELSVYRRRTHELEDYQRKNDALLRFVRKHAAAARGQGRGRQDQLALNGSGGGGGQRPWRLKETLAELSKSVRQSQPSLLPLVTQAQKALKEEIDENNTFHSILDTFSSVG